MRRLLVATNNAGKLREFRRLLAALPTELIAPSDVGIELAPDEPYDTYAENASAKADAFARASGLLTLADDSGIEVAALDWGPGVRSARWGGAGSQNAERLLAALDGIEDRRARMVCVVAVADPATEGTPIETFGGMIEGRVAPHARGSGGFGYDPVFLLPGGLTTAQLPEAEKDRISHRGRAVAAATPRLLEMLATG